jgi:deazaflavin-dependent oxidoreductase (nitroreductase family)
MPLNGEYAPSSARWVRDQVDKFESSNGSEGNSLRGMPIIVMTMRGVQSGKLRKVPVMKVEHDGVYAVVASKGGAAENPLWYFNLVANPQIEVQDGAVRRDATARLLSGDERAEWWKRAVAAYPDYADYQKKTRREIPVFVLE